MSECITSFGIKTTKLKTILKILNVFNDQACFIFEPSKLLIYCPDNSLIAMARVKLARLEFTSYNTKGQTVYVDIKKLSDIAKLVDDSTVTIEFDERTCTMVFGSIVRKFSIVENKTFDHTRVLHVPDIKTENSIGMKPAKIKAILSGMERYDKVMFKVCKDSFTVGEDDSEDYSIKTICDASEFIDYFTVNDKIWTSNFNPQILLKFVRSLPSKATMKMSIGNNLPMLINVFAGDPPHSTFFVQYVLSPICDPDDAGKVEYITESDEPTEQEICEVSQGVKAIVLDREDVENLDIKRDVNDRDLW